VDSTLPVPGKGGRASIPPHIPALHATLYLAPVDRQAPRVQSDELDLYIRTYYSLLRSSGEVRVRAFEEAHLYSRSSLHLGAMAPEPDLAAFAYSAARLPECMPGIRRVVLGQSLRQFEKARLPVDRWKVVRSRGRRRPLRWDGGQNLAVYIASASDIDDLVPIVAAYQLEWNKLHSRLSTDPASATLPEPELAALLGIDAEGVATLRAALGAGWREVLAEIAAHDCDIFVRLLDGSFREYQRSAQRRCTPPTGRGRCTSCRRTATRWPTCSAATPTSTATRSPTSREG
jgi:hypothetical protein